MTIRNRIRKLFALYYAFCGKPVTFWERHIHRCANCKLVLDQCTEPPEGWEAWYETIRKIEWKHEVDS